jgi:hypothetical protein
MESRDCPVWRRGAMRLTQTERRRSTTVGWSVLGFAAVSLFLSCATSSGVGEAQSGAASPTVARGAEFLPTTVNPEGGGFVAIGRVVTAQTGPIALPIESLWSLDGSAPAAEYAVTSLGPVANGSCRLVPKSMILSESGGVTISGVGLRKERGAFFMDLAPGTREACVLMLQAPPASARRFAFERPSVSAAATPRPVSGSDMASAPASNDWSRSFEGNGPVLARITNASDNELTVRVRNAGDEVIAQVKLPARGNTSVRLQHGNLTTQLRLERSGQVNYYRGPGIDVPSSAGELDLTLQAASFSNLTPIDAGEFSR